MWVDLLSAALRALSLVALFQAAGGSLVFNLFRRHLSASESVLRRLSIAAAAIGIALTIGQYLLEAARMAGEFAGVFDLRLQKFAAHSTLAVAMTWRVAGLLLIGISSGMSGRLSTVLSYLGVFVALASFTRTGHTTVTDLHWLLGLLLLLHLLLVAFWFGVLCPLFIQAPRNPAATRALAEDFSRWALWLVPLIPLLGLLLAIFLMDSAAAWTSPYGLLLVGKLAGFALLMMIAARNKLRLVPALSASNPPGAHRLRLAVGAEYALIVVVLTITSVLTTYYSPTD